MNWDKDIRFPEKKVDASWKDEATHKKENLSSGSSQVPSSGTGSSAASPSKPSQPIPKTSKPLMDLISSLGFQALMHLGEIPNPATQQQELNLEAAQEIINLLQALKEKTDGNTSREEKELLVSLVAELQMKFSERV